ncbi:olfactory receptor 12-like [Trachemys scripta elegans]|uniref:olfactory receptor 12-like n=1 Tax=Trachemys scripta elegans TaxID=31138 RepID=UPI001555B39E|nr:olfactory receptor 12-like [Trachemys scripta elegans]
METMKERNHTALTEFILLGFGSGLGLTVGPFVLFLVIYMTTVLVNTIMVFLISTSSRLHTPMYFFLMNLSLLDLCYAFTITPKAMASFLISNTSISFLGCATQLFFFGVFATTKAFILAAMAYDRYTTICNPLLYRITMSKQVCVLLLVGSYVCGGVNSMVQTVFTFTWCFCGSNEIDHFFCDIEPLLSLSCTNTDINEVVMFTLSSFIIVSTSMVILMSYAYIISAILRIRSAEGRHRAFSTCISHMMSVTLFYGTLTFMYAQPSSLASPAQSKVVSVFYTLVISMLNPLIYSLRNKDVKEAFRRTISSVFLK